MSGKKKSFDEKELRSTPGDFDRFIKSGLWFDIRTLIQERIDYLQEQLLMGNDSAVNDLIAIKNQMKAWNEMLGIPAYLKSCAHKDKPANQKELNYGN